MQLCSDNLVLYGCPCVEMSVAQGRFQTESLSLRISRQITSDPNFVAAYVARSLTHGLHQKQNSKGSTGFTHTPSGVNDTSNPES